jgi:uncharacterized membrane protein
VYYYNLTKNAVDANRTGDWILGLQATQVGYTNSYIGLTTTLTESYPSYPSPYLGTAFMGIYLYPVIVFVIIVSIVVSITVLFFLVRKAKNVS